MRTISSLIRRGALLFVGFVALVAVAWRCPAEPWTDGRVAGPFVCRADFPLGGTEGLIRDLAQLQDDLVRFLRVRPAREPIELYLFRDRESYDRFLKQYLPRVPYRRALYVRTGGVGRVFAYRSRQLAVDVRHECTHALLHAALPMVPLWLDEGLAEYFERSPTERAFDNPYLTTVRWYARLGIVSHPEKLENLGSLSEMGGAEYRNAWAWTHFMLHGPVEARQELARFLGEIQNRTPPGSLSRRLRYRIPDLKRRFAAHFRGWQR